MFTATEKNGLIALKLQVHMLGGNLRFDRQPYLAATRLLWVKWLVGTKRMTEWPA